MSEENLTTEQTDILLQFQVFIHKLIFKLNTEMLIIKLQDIAQVESIEECRHLLEACNWDITVVSFFSSLDNFFIKKVLF